MITKLFRLTVGGLIFLVTLIIIGGNSPLAHPVERTDQDPVGMVVSILPQIWFAERIGGEQVQVSALVGPGQSPAVYDVSARQMVMLQGSELFVSAGVPFENGLLPRIARLPSGPMITGVTPPPFSHHGHGHSHDGLDPHSWLDPIQAQVMADTMCAALSRIRPQYQLYFQSRREELRLDLEKLDREIRTILLPHQGREFFVFHPAFGHFAAAFGLSQVAIEADGHEPSAKHLAQVIERASRAGASAIIVQPQFSRKSAEAVARSLDVEVIALDPLAPNYEDNLLETAHKLDELFSRQPDGAAPLGQGKDAP